VRAMRRALLIAAALAALAAVPALATNVVRYDSTVTIKSKGTGFHGRVRSSAAACKQGRTVKLFRAQAGKDRVYGRDTTNAKGKWSIHVSGFAGISLAKFYARVVKRSEGTAGTIYVCRGDRSPSVGLSS
jgi:hypothetical protein